jgi:hypothetical protein
MEPSVDIQLKYENIRRLGLDVARENPNLKECVWLKSEPRVFFKKGGI